MYRNQVEFRLWCVREFYCYFIPKSGGREGRVYARMAAFSSESVGYQGNPFKLIPGSRSRFSPWLQHAFATPLKFRVERKEDSGGTGMWVLQREQARGGSGLGYLPLHVFSREQYDKANQIKKHLFYTCFLGQIQLRG